jgi:hypothetical protein
MTTKAEVLEAGYCLTRFDFLMGIRLLIESSSVRPRESQVREVFTSEVLNKSGVHMKVMKGKSEDSL